DAILHLRSPREQRRVATDAGRERDKHELAIECPDESRALERQRAALDPCLRHGRDRGAGRGLRAQAIALHTFGLADEDLLGSAQGDSTHHPTRARTAHFHILEVEATTRALP